jgi:hypothetical protein
MITLGFVHNMDFVSRYIDETVNYVIPIAEMVDKNMLIELGDLIESRRKYLSNYTKLQNTNS